MPDVYFDKKYVNTNMFDPLCGVFRFPPACIVITAMFKHYFLSTEMHGDTKVSSQNHRDLRDCFQDSTLVLVHLLRIPSTKTILRQSISSSCSTTVYHLNANLSSRPNLFITTFINSTIIVTYFVCLIIFT